MKQKKRYIISHSNIISDVFGDEVVLVNLDTGVYYSLRSSATHIWIRLVSNYSFEEIISDLSHFYDVDIKELENQVENFIQMLLDNQLIRTNENSSKVDLTMDHGVQKAKFSSPIFEMYSDMQEILLLDPVHDVDKAGWPVIKENKAPN